MISPINLNAKIRQYIILISYLVAAPVGLITVFIVFLLPIAVSDEGFAAMVMFGVYGKATIGLVISFLIILSFAGVDAYKDFVRGNSLIRTSIRYSLTVNLVIWSVFIAIVTIENFGKDVLGMIMPAVIALIFSVITSSFTIGLLICYLIKRRIIKESHGVS